MTQPTPKQDYVFTFAQDNEGQDIKFRFMLTLSKHMKHAFGKEETVESRLIKALGTLDGIDAVQVNVGRYTLEISIARTFDPNEVIAELERRLKEEVLTEIVKPKLAIVTK